ncbi:MAG: hypothetical protein ACOYL6_10060 [Bacteriovoracaceae bacterium]
MKTYNWLIQFTFVVFLIFSSEAFAKSGCHKHSDCSGGKGCYASDPGNDTDEDDQSLLGRLFGDKEQGKGCGLDFECQSGACVDVCKKKNDKGECTETKKQCGEYHECMFAPNGESAPGDIKCEGQDDPEAIVKKDSKGVCTGGNYKYVVMIPAEVDVGSMDKNTCAVKINEKSYQAFLNNFYSLAAFEYMFQNPTTEQDCLPTTHNVKNDLAVPLKTLHAAVSKAFKANYFEGFLKPSEWLAKHGTEKDGNCGAVQSVLANLNATHFMTNTVLLYGDRYKEIVYGANNKVAGIDGLPTGLSGYIDLFPKATALSDKYFENDWSHYGNDYHANKCRNINWSRYKRNWWQRRYRLPDGLPQWLLDFVGGKADEKKIHTEDVLKASALGLVTSGASWIALYQGRQFTFVDPILPKGMNFDEYCGGFLAGSHRRRCYRSDMEWEMARTNKPGFVHVFKEGVGQYYQDSVSTNDSQTPHLFGVLADNPEVQMTMAKMSFGNLFWYSGHTGSAQHPVTRRKVFFRIIENNLYSLVNYLKKINEIRKDAMNCLSDKAQQLQALCYDPSGSLTSNFDKDKNKKDGGDGKAKNNRITKNGVQGLSVGGGAGFIPDFTTMLNKTDAAKGASGDSKLGAGVVAADSLFNKAVDSRKREIKAALDGMSAKDKEMNESFNKGVNKMFSLSPAAMAAVTGANKSATSSSSGMGAAVTKIEPKKETKPAVAAPVAPISHSIDIPEVDYSAESSGKNNSSPEETTGMSEEEVNTMLHDAKTEKYKTADGDDIFQIISKTYVREGYSRLLKKKAEIKVEGEALPKKKENKKVDKLEDIN